MQRHCRHTVEQCAGQLDSFKNKIIRIVFHFDSFDNLANHYAGWYVDNLEGHAGGEKAWAVSGPANEIGGTYTSVAGLRSTVDGQRDRLAVMTGSSVSVITTMV